MQNLLDLSGHTLIGVMFGSVNDSIWEIEKTLLFPYLLWAGIELLCIKIPFRKFIVAKAVSLWFFCLSYSAICLLYSLTGAQTHFLPEFTAALICCTLAFFISFRLTVGNKKCEVLFYPAFLCCCCLWFCTARLLRSLCTIIFLWTEPQGCTA